MHMWKIYPQRSVRSHAHAAATAVDIIPISFLNIASTLLICGVVMMVVIFLLLKLGMVMKIEI